VGQSAAVIGYLLVLAATVIWSGNFIVARGLSDSIPPVTLAFLRSATAVIVLLPFGIRPFCRDIKLVWKHLGYLALTAFFGLTLSTTLVYICAHTSKALNLSLIAICSPVFIVIFARLFLHDTFTLQRIAGLLTATVGAALLITDGEPHRLRTLSFSAGDVWMFVQSATFAMYCILARIKPAEITSGVFLSSMFVFGLLFLVPWLCWELRGVESINFSPVVLGGIAYLGIGSSVLAYLCWNRAITIIGPVRCGFVYYTLPLFSGVEAFLLLNEPIRWVHAVSGVLILVGVIVATRE
jgi:drug/metabolite transporter (DMT)-like permease